MVYLRLPATSLFNPRPQVQAQDPAFERIIFLQRAAVETLKSGAPEVAVPGLAWLLPYLTVAGGCGISKKRSKKEAS